MAARGKKNTINLLPQEEFAQSTIGRVLAWLLSTFRIIVIVTEVFVMAVFLSRFWLDARSADLNDLIKQRQAVLAASSEFENEFRSTQEKLKIFSALTAVDEPVTNQLGSASELVPPEIVLISFSIANNEIKLEGLSPNERGIAQFIANLEASEVFEEVAITQISTDKETQIFLAFSLKLSVKGGK